LSILEETAGADKNTFDASTFSGALAFSCNNVMSIASILSITESPFQTFIFSHALSKKRHAIAYDNIITKKDVRTLNLK